MEGSPPVVVFRYGIWKYRFAVACLVGAPCRWWLSFKTGVLGSCLASKVAYLSVELPEKSPNNMLLVCCWFLFEKSKLRVWALEFEGRKPGVLPFSWADCLLPVKKLKSFAAVLRIESGLVWFGLGILFRLFYSFDSVRTADKLGFFCFIIFISNCCVLEKYCRWYAQLFRHNNYNDLNISQTK